MLRRLGYIALVLIWLVIMCLPILALAIAMKGEVSLGASERAHVRTFMVQDEGIEGIAFEWARKHGSDGHCLDTSVRYILWEGESADFNVDYCYCLQDIDGQYVFERSC